MNLKDKLNSIAVSWHQIAFKGKPRITATLKRNASNCEMCSAVDDVPLNSPGQPPKGEVIEASIRPYNTPDNTAVRPFAYRWVYTIMRFEPYRGEK